MCLNVHLYLFTCIECAEYQDAVFERVYSSVGISGTQAEQKVFRCSIATVPLVVGGENAQPKEFPHMVTEIASATIPTTASICSQNQNVLKAIIKQ